jgi:transposase
MRSGRPSFLNDSQKSELERVIRGNSLDYGYNTATWTGVLVIDFIKKRFWVEYKTAQIYNILRSLGFSYQKGRGYFPESEERTEKLENVKKNSNL